MIGRWIILLALLVSACSSTGIKLPGATDETTYIAWPPTPEKARIEYVEQFRDPEDLDMNGSWLRGILNFLAGEEDRSMSRPYAIAVNNMYMAVADPGKAVVHLFNRDKKDYHRMESVGGHYFRSPIGLALGAERLFIADSVLNKVFILDNKLKLLSVLDDFQRPTGLAFDPKRSRFYVADTLAHVVKVFDRDGEFLFDIGERGEQDFEFNYPSHLAFSSDRLFINDTLNFRIQVFSHDGQHLKTFGKQGSGTGHFGQSKGVAIDADGHVYIADALSNRIQIFNQEGVFLLSFGHNGDVPGAFQMPTGLAIWDDMIYVADSYNQRVQVFRYLSEGQ